MNTKFYIKGLIVFMAYFLNEDIELVNSASKYLELRGQLSRDFQEISQFSEKMRSYQISKQEFEFYFLKGAMKSYNFHQSPKHIKQTNLNRIIEEKLMHHRSLKHPLKKPAENNSVYLKNANVLNTFSGQWSGKWQSMIVRHLWLPFKNIEFKINELYKIIGFQTCFTGDGFGWNYLIQKGEEVIILGHVYHFNKKGTLDYENPHYAYLNDQSQLTWVSNNHIYYEFVCNNKKCANKKHYVITALPYTIDDRVKFGKPIQAIYESEKNQ